MARQRYCTWCGRPVEGRKSFCNRVCRRKHEADEEHERRSKQQLADERRARRQRGNN